ncbi:MAG: hypothetical protein KA436_01655 [Oligoflexales bacterium]|nr:hypothetical protein [Oligoflexales bacterium]
MRTIHNLVLILALSVLGGSQLWAGISIDPFVSVSSTKSITPQAKDKSKEDAKVKQRTMAGIRASISFFRIFKLQLSVGQSTFTTTEKVQNAVDDYDQIDYEKDLNADTRDPSAEIKTSDVMNRAQANVIIDPSFWIFFMRAKAGVTAMQRTVGLEQAGVKTETKTPIIYKPSAGAGAGIRIGSKMFAIAEYNLFLYKFPEMTPFEREVLVSYGLNL